MVNFISYKRNSRVSLKYYFIVNMTILTIVILVLTYLQVNAVQRALAYKRKKISLTKKIGKYIPEINKYNLLQKKIEEIKSTKDNIDSNCIIFPVEDLKIISNVIADNMYLDKLVYKYNRIIKLEGVSTTVVSIANFIDKLISTSRWKSVNLVQLSNNNGMYYFNILINI